MYDRMIPAAGQLFQDKEGAILQFIVAAAEKGKSGKVAVYQELSGEYGIYAMDYGEFLKEMTPRSPEKEGQIPGDTLNIQEKSVREPEKAIWQPEIRVEQNESTDRKEEIHPLLLSFLEADTYEEKLNIITGGRKHLNDRLINHMAISIDCIVDEGKLEDRIDHLIYCLKTHARFEDKRLR